MVPSFLQPGPTAYRYVIKCSVKLNTQIYRARMYHVGTYLNRKKTDSVFNTTLMLFGKLFYCPISVYVCYHRKNDHRISVKLNMCEPNI